MEIFKRLFRLEGNECVHDEAMQGMARIVILRAHVSARNEKNVAPTFIIVTIEGIPEGRASSVHAHMSAAVLFSRARFCARPRVLFHRSCPSFCRSRHLASLRAPSLLASHVRSSVRFSFQTRTRSRACLRTMREEVPRNLRLQLLARTRPVPTVRLRHVFCARA